MRLFPHSRPAPREQRLPEPPRAPERGDLFIDRSGLHVYAYLTRCGWLDLFADTDHSIAYNRGGYIGIYAPNVADVLTPCGDALADELHVLLSFAETAGDLDWCLDGDARGAFNLPESWEEA